MGIEPNETHTRNDNCSLGAGSNDRLVGQKEVKTMAENGNNLNGKRIAFLATDGVEQVELTDPWQAVKSAGATPELISIKSGKIQGWNHDKKGKKFTVNKLVEEVGTEDYDGLVLPGGVMNPDTLRM
jgi:DJ-1/PfpI family